MNEAHKVQHLVHSLSIFSRKTDTLTHWSCVERLSRQKMHHWDTNALLQYEVKISTTKNIALIGGRGWWPKTLFKAQHSYLKYIEFYPQFSFTLALKAWMNPLGINSKWHKSSCAITLEIATWTNQHYQYDIDIDNNIVLYSTILGAIWL